MFEPIWNRNYVDYVEITAAETAGVGTRAGYYEEAGALRDMVANHLLQLLTLTAMEPPVAFDADNVREEKVQVLRSIRRVKPEQIAERTVRAQYGPGVIDDEKVKGYKEEEGSCASLTNRDLRGDRVQHHKLALVGRAVSTFAQGNVSHVSLTEFAVHLKRTTASALSRRTACR
jgi:hypothetical protein